MTYEQPTVSTLGSAQRLVQGGNFNKNAGICVDHFFQTRNSSVGAYEVDE